MLLEVADSSITYRSRYFTVLQAAPVVDLLMNDEANPRSLAFQLKDLARHCAALSAMPSGADWPVLKQRQMEAAAARLLNADVELLCEARTGSNRTRLDGLLEDLGAALPAFSRSHRQHLFQPRGNGAGDVIYRVRHQTIYDYVQPVSVSHHVVRLTPRDLRGQQTPLSSELSVWPVPPFHATTHTDFFGNTVTSFTLPESHTRMSVEASSELEVQAVALPVFSESPAWETVRDTVSKDQSAGGVGRLPVRLRFASASRPSQSWPTMPAIPFLPGARSSRRSSTSLPASIRISVLTPRRPR